MLAQPSRGGPTNPEVVLIGNECREKMFCRAGYNCPPIQVGERVIWRYWGNSRNNIGSIAWSWLVCRKIIVGFPPHTYCTYTTWLKECSEPLSLTFESDSKVGWMCFWDGLSFLRLQNLMVLFGQGRRVASVRDSVTALWSEMPSSRSGHPRSRQGHLQG